MKKVKVTKEFRDKEDNEKLVQPPTVLERSDDRAKEIVDAGHGEYVEDDKPAPKKKAASKKKAADKDEEKK